MTPSSTSRSSRIAGVVLILAAAGLIAGLLSQAPSPQVGVAAGSGSASGESAGLTVSCAAGLKPSLEAAAAAFQQECGETVHLQFGGSGELLSSIAVTHQGDLFVAADRSYVDQAEQQGLGSERFALATQHPVLAVAAGNPKHIGGIADLEQDGIRLGLANPETASIGRITKKVLTASGQWQEFSQHILVTKPTVMDIASDLRLGALDAAVLWDATLLQVPGIERVPVPVFDGASETVTACVLASSAHPTEAIRFARFLAAPERGNRIFAAHGYTPVIGDSWALRPALTIFSGAVNRAAIDALVTGFSQREGADVTTVVNGCGILCATMKALAATPGARLPDAYYACDICFVPPVVTFYPDAVLLTQTPIVIAVAPGNPLGIHSLIDLARPGLRLGISNAEQSSLGFITKRMLFRANLWDKVSANASSQVPTADLLVNQLLIGSLDAAIVYSTNVTLTHGRLQAVGIDNPAAKAVQPFAIAKDSANRQLAGRLLAHLQANRSVFAEVGFAWREDQRPVVSASLPQLGGDLDAHPPILVSGGTLPAPAPAHGQ